jgi:integrase
MQNRYRKFRRNWGTYYVEDTLTGKQESLETKDKAKAERLVATKNEAALAPAFCRKIAQSYWQAGDPAAATRTWQHVLDEILRQKKGNTLLRWQSASKDKALDSIRNLVLLETRPEHFFAVLNAGGVSTNSYLRRIHTFALNADWLPWPILPKSGWPTIRFKKKRAITKEEHEKILAGERTPEWRAYYELLWHLGGAQTDVATLRAENIDRENRTVSYDRAKTKVRAIISYGDLAENIFKTLPATGYLFPQIAPWRHSDRAKAFIRRCKLVGVSGVSLHSYRYSWAERAKRAGYPLRFAQEALGHNSIAVHQSYARNAETVVPSLESFETNARERKVVPFPGLENQKPPNHEDSGAIAGAI